MVILYANTSHYNGSLEHEKIVEKENGYSLSSNCHLKYPLAYTSSFDRKTMSDVCLYVMCTYTSETLTSSCQYLRFVLELALFELRTVPNAKMHIPSNYNTRA